ncbi:AAA-type ATPase family protein isoform 2 [Hibiscus syriacus]|uniref:AAA-type ATPase family protein isoform 2 n=1 Tax=Hibiscus syriacus TaxID=106335 RepID=A0A6A3CX89_HIBSY|nr:AAA-type ATPase family protein isoform 2 [Hibiscus syriacus]
MDGRRHSVDLPISRTLVALRRVRSLRDPSTNSISKFSSLFDNVKWEANSSNGCPEPGPEPNELQTVEYLTFDGRRKEHSYDFELHSFPGKSNSKLIPCGNVQLLRNIDCPDRSRQVFEDGCRWDFKDYALSNKKEFHNKRPMGFKDEGLNLTLMSPSCNSIDACNGSSSVERVNHCALEQKSQTWNQVMLYGENGDVACPCPSVDVVSGRNTSLYADEDVELADDSSHHGCGISFYWSKDPRLRESNPTSDFEDLPLLPGDTNETSLCGQTFWKCINGEINSYSNSPRSLSQKFRPKSFDELVGQNVVVRSLLSSISKGRVTSFYLFHGPRGTGKTIASRIFAAALNCQSVELHKPCGQCRECILFFSGRSKDVKEVDSLKINHTDRLRSLVKNVIAPPVSSLFKIFIIDECQLLQGETWATILNSLEKLSQNIVFVMSTPEIDLLPRSAVSWSQRYHFPRIKDYDISNRDAEMMLDQLSLLGKKITVPLTYELIGTVSDEELLDLLDLALSCDTSNTVIRSRELMRSKIDPMQLISHLANLITDILTGKCDENGSEAGRKFSRKHSSEADLQKLSHALRTLSETEKHLRVSKNQTTWLTAALLQLSSMDSNLLETTDSKLCLENSQWKAEGGSNSTSSSGENPNHLLSCMCNSNNSKIGKRDSEGRLESIWNRTTELCQSGSLKKFLRKHGRLSSLCINQGLAIAELEFGHANHASRAEKSWKHIASSLQFIVGCNVEIRINHSDTGSVSKFAKVRKLSCSLFSCSHRLYPKSRSSTKSRSDSEVSKNVYQKPGISDGPILSCYSGHGFEIPHNDSCVREVVTAFRNSEGNILSSGATPSCEPSRDDTSPTAVYGVYSSKGEGRDYECRILPVHEPDYLPNCFPRALRPKKKVHLSDSTKMISSGDQEGNKLA